MIFKTIFKALTGPAAKAIAVHGVAIPIIATLVGFEVQKALIKREQNKAQQQVNKEDAINAEVVEN